MTRLSAPQGTLTLQASLEVIARMGRGYIIGWKAEDWTAENLLAWLRQEAPVFLSMDVYLVPPDATSDGALYGVDSFGRKNAETLLYRIKRRQPTGSLR